VLWFLRVIGIFIIVGLSAAPVLFMLAFLNAIVRELRMERAQRGQERRKSSVTLVMLERYRRKDLAA
jgi:uncharacterized membrane protein YqhA